MRILFKSILLLSIAVIQIFIYGQETKWKGSIERIDGIEVIKNPKKPLYGEDVFILEEELSIGESEGYEDYMFSTIISIDVDEDGNIYVLDLIEAHVKVFDKNGRLKKIIGREGQGPGEFQKPFTLQITDNHNIVVWDPMPQKLTFLTIDGKYIKSISTSGIFNPPLIAQDGDIICTVKTGETNNPKYELRRLDQQMNSISFYYSYPKYNSSRDGFNSFRSSLKWGIIKNSGIVCGLAGEGYNLNVFNSNGEILKKITKDYTPIRIPAEAIKRATKRKLPTGYFYSVPKHYNPFRWIVTDEEDRMFVCTWERSEDNGGRYYDVFNTEGQCIAKVPIAHAILMGRRLIFKGTKLYLVFEDENGYQYVKRYKVTWKI